MSFVSRGRRSACARPFRVGKHCIRGPQCSALSAQQRESARQVFEGHTTHPEIKNSGSAFSPRVPREVSEAVQFCCIGTNRYLGESARLTGAGVGRESAATHPTPSRDPPSLLSSVDRPPSNHSHQARSPFSVDT